MRGKMLPKSCKYGMKSTKKKYPEKTYLKY